MPVELSVLGRCGVADAARESDPRECSRRLSGTRRRLVRFQQVRCRPGGRGCRQRRLSGRRSWKHPSVWLHTIEDGAAVTWQSRQRLPTPHGATGTKHRFETIRNVSHPLRRFSDSVRPTCGQRGAPLRARTRHRSGPSARMRRRPAAGPGDS
jgi:hypothetical protein